MVHPNDNTATVRMRADDLMELIRGHGNAAELSEIPCIPEITVGQKDAENRT